MGFVDTLDFEFNCDVEELFSEAGEDMRAYSADFETTTDPDDCRVWAWAVCEVANPSNISYGNDIAAFFKFAKLTAPSKFYFHNLGFDGAFIQDYLLKHDWQWSDERKPTVFPSFTTIISDMNQLYCIKLWFNSTQCVTIHDSMKIIPMSVKQVAKSFGLDEGKGELDYESYREPGHELTDVEKDYIRRDVQIVAYAMQYFHEQGMDRMTAASNALYDFKHGMGGDREFRKIYPELTEEQDTFIRRAYRGGFTYADPRWAGKEIGRGIVFDVNSLYPSVMASCDGQMLPMYAPEWFDGEPKATYRQPLWVALVSCSFKVKKDHIPCIQLKNNCRFSSTEYLRESKGIVQWYVTNVDWDLITQQYDVKHVRWFGGYRFHAGTGQFKQYVSKWTEKKIEAGKQGNKGLRTLAKLMLNSLYGKFATRCEVFSRRPEIGEDGSIRYVDLPPETKKGVYLPVGVFVTSWARYKTVTSCQKVYDRFLYADTDSMHLIGDEIPDDIDVDPFRLGAWKLESTFVRAKFLRAKCYMELMEESEVPTVHVAGMPSNVHSQVTFANFEVGAEYDGKLYQHKVPGGIVLIPGKMQIREH